MALKRLPNAPSITSDAAAAVGGRHRRRRSLGGYRLSKPPRPSPTMAAAASIIPTVPSKTLEFQLVGVLHTPPVFVSCTLYFSKLPKYPWLQVQLQLVEVFPAPPFIKFCTHDFTIPEMPLVTGWASDQWSCSLHPTGLSLHLCSYTITKMPLVTDWVFDQQSCSLHPTGLSLHLCCNSITKLPSTQVGLWSGFAFYTPSFAPTLQLFTIPKIPF